MKLFFIGLSLLLTVLALDANAQFKPSEQQYLEQTNLAFNSGFEQGLRNWTNANGVFSVDSTNFVLGKKSGKVALTAQTLDFSQTLSTGYSTALSGLQGHVAAYAKADFPFQVCALIDGVESNCVNGSGDNKFDFYDIPIVLGSSSLGIKFKSLTSYTGAIYIDGVEYGHKQFISSIAQTERFGKATWTGAANCEWRATVAVSANYYELAADSDCNDPVIEGNIQPPTTKKPAIVLPSGSPAGTYSFRWTGSPRNEANVTAICHFRFTDGTNNTASGRIYSGAGNDSETPNLLGSITYDSALTSDTEIKIEASGNASSIICTNYNDKTWSKQSFEVVYHPPQSQIVRQGTENFAKSLGTLTFPSNANCDWTNPKSTIAWTSFSADSDCIVATASTGSVIQATANKIPQFVLPSGSKKGLYKIRTNGIFHNDFNVDNKACWYRFSDGTINSTANSEYASGSDSFDGSKTFEFILDEDTIADKTFTLQSSPVGVSGSGNCIFRNLYTTVQNTVITVEYVPTDQKMTITGSFEQIKSTELCQVEAYGNDNDTITQGTEDIPWKTETLDNCNAWSNVGNTDLNTNDAYTAQKNGFLLITGTIRAANSTGRTVYLYKDSVLHKWCNTTGTGISNSHHFTCLFEAVKDSVYTIRQSNATSNLDSTDGNLRHWISITEVPDTASIVKNLNDNKNVKYQKKLLTASSFSDVNFSNLVIGKKYRVKTSVSKGTGSTAINMEGSHDGQVLVQNYLNDTTGRTFSAETAIFTATATTFTFAGSGVSSVIVGEKSYVEIIEYPDYYIETSEF